MDVDEEICNVDRGTTANRIIPRTVTCVIPTSWKDKMQKGSENARARNERIEAALADYRNKVYKSVNAAAKAHDVLVQTLQERASGGKSRAEANEAKQLLSAVEEQALVKWILEVSQNGLPPSWCKSQLWEMAEDICQQRVALINDTSIILVEYPPIGKEWLDRFIRRHLCLKMLKFTANFRLNQDDRNGWPWLNVFAGTEVSLIHL